MQKTEVAKTLAEKWDGNWITDLKKETGSIISLQKNILVMIHCLRQSFGSSGDEYFLRIVELVLVIQGQVAIPL